MSRIKELKKNPETNMNLIDLLGLFCSEENKSKYVETLYKSVKNRIFTKVDKDKYFKDFSKRYDISKGELIKIPFFQLTILASFLDIFYLNDDFKTFKKFIEFNERGIVANKDLSTYNSFDQIRNAVSAAELRDIEKGLENQIKKVHDSAEWLIVRPLTFHASRKYGSATKWCTTTEKQPSYFLNYAGNGVLIYVINKKNGHKVAVHNNNKELTFWNQIDIRIDSMQSDLPTDILKIIKDEIDKFPMSNLSLLSKEDRDKQEKLNYNGKSSEVVHGPRRRRVINVDDFEWDEQDIAEGVEQDMAEDVPEDFVEEAFVFGDPPINDHTDVRDLNHEELRLRAEELRQIVDDMLIIGNEPIGEAGGHEVVPYIGLENDDNEDESE